MGWLVGLPLGLFRLLGSILLVALRFACLLYTSPSPRDA